MGTLLLVIVLVPLIGSAVFVGVTFLLAWWVFPGGGSRGPHDTLASRVFGLVLVVVAEYLATVWLVVMIPFRFMQPAPTRRRLYPDRVPVVLLACYLGNRLTMWLMKYRLWNSYSFQFWVAPFDHLCLRLDQVIHPDQVVAL